MTTTYDLPDRDDDDLAVVLSGPEPDWLSDPEPPPDLDRANAMLYRMRKLAEERTGIVANAQAEIDRATTWRDRRCETIDRQTGWLDAALRRYHAAVYARSGEATINLPNGVLKSTKLRDSVEFDDEFTTWLYPGDLLLALADIKNATDALVAGKVSSLSPLPAGARVKVSITPEIARDPAKHYVLASGEKVPGATPFKASKTDRKYEVIPAVFDAEDMAPPVEEAV